MISPWKVFFSLSTNTRVSETAQSCEVFRKLDHRHLSAGTWTITDKMLNLSLGIITPTSTTHDVAIWGNYSLPTYICIYIYKMYIACKDHVYIHIYHMLHIWYICIYICIQIITTIIIYGVIFQHRPSRYDTLTRWQATLSFPLWTSHLLSWFLCPGQSGLCGLEQPLVYKGIF